MNHQIKRKKLDVVRRGKRNLQLIVEVNWRSVKVIEGGGIMENSDYLLPYDQFKKMAINKAVKYKY